MLGSTNVHFIIVFIIIIIIINVCTWCTTKQKVAEVPSSRKQMCLLSISEMSSSYVSVLGGRLFTA